MFIYLYILIKGKTNTIFKAKIFQLLPLSIHDIHIYAYAYIHIHIYTYAYTYAHKHRQIIHIYIYKYLVWHNSPCLLTKFLINI